MEWIDLHHGLMQSLVCQRSMYSSKHVHMQLRLERIDMCDSLV